MKSRKCGDKEETKQREPHSTTARAEPLLVRPPRKARADGRSYHTSPLEPNPSDADQYVRMHSGACYKGGENKMGS